jgi:hypothetical protein
MLKRDTQPDLICAPFLALCALLCAEALHFGSVAFVSISSAAARLLAYRNAVSDGVDWSRHSRDIEGLTALGALLAFECAILCIGLLVGRAVAEDGRRRAEDGGRPTTDGR